MLQNGIANTALLMASMLWNHRIAAPSTEPNRQLNYFYKSKMKCRRGLVRVQLGCVLFYRLIGMPLSFQYSEAQIEKKEDWRNAVALSINN
jgi:hypothetical protein